jgi:hypothetical protein
MSYPVTAPALHFMLKSHARIHASLVELHATRRLGIATMSLNPKGASASEALEASPSQMKEMKEMKGLLLCFYLTDRIARAAWQRPTGERSGVGEPPNAASSVTPGYEGFASASLLPRAADPGRKTPPLARGISMALHGAPGR